MHRGTEGGKISDDEGDESLVQLGTRLLDPLGPRGTKRHRTDPDALAREYVPVWQQEARDAQGRKRFHGAFTGGFSAGYFNTVGSKEGWKPQSFYSSRKAKAASTVADTAPVNDTRRWQAVEDFMDEEDLEDRRNQPVEIKASFQRKRRQKATPAQRFDFSAYEEDAEEYDTFFRPQSACTATGRIPLRAATPPAVGHAIPGPHILSTLTDHLTKALQGPSPSAVPTVTASVGEQLLGKVGWQPPRVPRTNTAKLAALETRRPAPLTPPPSTRPRGTFHAVILDSDEDDSPRPAPNRLQAPPPIQATLPEQPSIPNQTTVAPSVGHTPCHRCHDNRPPLPGFILITERVEWPLDENTAGTAQVPPDFVPGRTILALWRSPESTPAVQRTLSEYRHKHPKDNQGVRGSRTVAQYLDQQARARLVRHADRMSAPQALPDTTIDTRALSQQQNNQQPTTNPSPSPMLARFTRATGEDINRPILQPGLQHFVPPPSLQASAINVQQDACHASAPSDIKPMVRATTTFLPHRLLSKRFHLPTVLPNARSSDHKHPAGPTTPSTTSRPLVATLDQAISQEFNQDAVPQSLGMLGPGSNTPSTSLFKAVFEDDSDSNE
ncbi:hypothetical protein H4R35_000182 [Dimargaris xerosporica]|nr:hypothetical protein H4R35_000182 [Dimargaris xerosporica]